MEAVAAIESLVHAWDCARFGESNTGWPTLAGVRCGVGAYEDTVLVWPVDNPTRETFFDVNDYDSLHRFLDDVFETVRSW